MEAPRFELLEYLLGSVEACKYDLAQSNMPPLSLGELGPLEEVELDWSPVDGSDELRQLVASHAGVPRDRVLVTQGASEANLLVGMALLKSGSKVVVERPYYEPLWKAFSMIGARISYLERPFEEGFRLPPENLHDSLPPDTSLVVLTNLHNPGGTLLKEEALRELAFLAEEGDFYVLVDEVFREAAFERAPPCALAISDRFIVTSSPSKFYGIGGLRIGWCLAAPDVLDRIRAVKRFTTVAPPVVSDVLAIRALQKRERVRERNGRLIRRNRRLVEEWIEEHDEVEWVPPDGYVSFPRYYGAVERLADVALRKHGAAIAPGRFFGSEEHFRLCFGMETEELQAGLEALSAAMKDV